MTLTDEQKKLLVPASVGAATFALAREFLFKGKKSTTNSALAAAAAAVGSYFAYDKADATTKAKVDPYLIPAGAAAGALLVGDIVTEKQRWPRYYALGAAAGAGVLAYKELTPSAATVAGYLR